jgi:hypothetical protein
MALTECERLAGANVTPGRGQSCRCRMCSTHRLLRLGRHHHRHEAAGWSATWTSGIVRTCVLTGGSPQMEWL